MATQTWDEFRRDYIEPHPDRVAAELNLDETTFEDHPFIIIHHQGRTMALSIMPLDNHLCVDAHAFVNGQDARVGVFGMELGYATTFPEDKVKGKSHNWPAARMVALLLGKQTED